MNITHTMLMTLREMNSYRDYTFRQATCRTLVDMGLARKCDDRERPRHVRTELGDKVITVLTGKISVAGMCFDVDLQKEGGERV